MGNLTKFRQKIDHLTKFFKIDEIGKHFS